MGQYFWIRQLSMFRTVDRGPKDLVETQNTRWMVIGRNLKANQQLGFPGGTSNFDWIFPHSKRDQFDVCRDHDSTVWHLQVFSRVICSDQTRLHGIASGNCESSPCIIRNNGSQTVTARFVMRPLPYSGML